MSILTRLSSPTRDRTEYHNRKAALECLEDPDLLEEIAEGLRSGNPALMADCAEVLAMVAEDQPEWVAAYDRQIAELVRHPKTKVRWEAVHALARIAQYAPETVESLLPVLADIIRADTSVIARDYAVQAVGNYAWTGREAAEKAYPVLVEALTMRNGKQAHHALDGLAKAADHLPERREELLGFADRFAGNPRGVVRKAARGLERVLGG